MADADAAETDRLAVLKADVASAAGRSAGPSLSGAARTSATIPPKTSAAVRRHAGGGIELAMRNHRIHIPFVKTPQDAATCGP